MGEGSEGRGKILHAWARKSIRMPLQWQEERSEEKGAQQIEKRERGREERREERRVTIISTPIPCTTALSNRSCASSYQHQLNWLIHPLGVLAMPLSLSFLYSLAASLASSDPLLEWREPIRGLVSSCVSVHVFVSVRVSSM